MKLKLLAIALLAVFSAHSAHADFKAKMLAKLAKAMAPAAPSTASLSDVSLTVVMESNLAPTELGTISQSFIPGWKTGGDGLVLMFSQKKGTGFLKIDGTVSVDGAPAEYLTIGNYTVVTEASPAPRNVEILTRTGEKASFTVAPSKAQIKLLSVNGKKKDIEVDLNKDVVLELEGTSVPPNALVKISLAINQLGIKSLYEVCYVRFAPKLTIPAAAFRNINIVPGASAAFSYKKSFLAVGLESMENATNVSGAFPAVQYTSQYTDGKFVEVDKEPELNLGIAAKGKETPKAGEVEYDFFKPNAFRSRPAGQIRKIGLLSFGITGTTIVEHSVIVEEKNENKEGLQVSKTETITFPMQSNATWDAVLAKLYPEIQAILQAELNAQMLPVDAITKAASYKVFENYAVADRNTREGFSLNYRGTKFLTPIPVTESFGVNAANERILRETGADALMTLTLNLEAQRDGDFGVMVPKLTCELVGKINGVNTNTKFFSGTVTGKGVPSENIGLIVRRTDQKDPKVFNNPGTISAAELEKIVRQSDLLAAFRKGLKELMDKEKANTDYAKVWALQD
jgi:hypothetical protein